MTEDHAGIQFPVVTHIEIAINRVEDRIALVVQTRRHGLRFGWLTRRLARPLLVRFAEAIEDSGHTGKQVLAGYRDEALQMERVAALASQSSPDGEQPVGNEYSGDGRRIVHPDRKLLLTHAHLEARDDRIVVAFDGVAHSQRDHPEPAFALSLTRPNAHQVLATLQDKAEEAGWDLHVPSTWGSADSVQTNRTMN